MNIDFCNPRCGDVSHNSTRSPTATATYRPVRETPIIFSCSGKFSLATSEKDFVSQIFRTGCRYEATNCPLSERLLGTNSPASAGSTECSSRACLPSRSQVG